MTVEQLTLLTPTHRTTTYTLTHRVHVHRGGERYDTRLITWWAYRCTCGHDVGAGNPPRALYSGEDSADRQAWHHRHDTEPWANPLPGPPVPGYPKGPRHAQRPVHHR